MVFEVVAMLDMGLFNLGMRDVVAIPLPHAGQRYIFRWEPICYGLRGIVFLFSHPEMCSLDG